MKPAFVPLLLLASSTLAAASETIGPVTVTATPSSASLITGGGPAFDWLHVADEPVGLGAAFHGFPVLDDGFGNPATGTVIALHFAAGTLVNGPGPDVAVFDARYDFGAYALSADVTGFTIELTLPELAFVPTGESRDYYYGVSGVATTADVHVALVDLALLGVPPGAAVSTLHLEALNAHCDPVGVGSLTPQAAGQAIAGHDVVAAPVDATLIAGGDGLTGALNLVEQDLTVAEALSGLPLGERGQANLPTDTVVELRFAAGTLVNGPGDDLLVLDARFDAGACAVSTELDGFTAEVTLAIGDFAATGESRDFFFLHSTSPPGPYTSELYAATVDLSDLGVPSDAVVELVRLRSVNDGPDLVGVGSLHAAFRGDVATISLASGGTLTLSLEPGPSHAGKVYLVAGSMAGTSPGFPLGTLHVPLNVDPYLSFTIGSPGVPPLVGTLGLIDGAGHATAMVVLPPGTSPTLAGVTVHHAFGLLTPGLGPDYVSNAVAVELVP